MDEPESVHSWAFSYGLVRQASLKQIVVVTSRELCCRLSRTSHWYFVILCVWQTNDNTKRKQVDTPCVNQSDTPKWEEPCQRDIYISTKYYNMPKYVVHVLGRAVSKSHRSFSESRNH